MNEENAQVIYDLLDRIKVTDENRERMEKIRKFLSESKFQEALDELQILQMSGNVEYEDYAEVKEKERKIKERKQEEGGLSDIKYKNLKHDIFNNKYFMKKWRICVLAHLTHIRPNSNSVQNGGLS